VASLVVIENKVPVVAAVSCDEAGHPVYKTLPPAHVPFALLLIGAQDFTGDKACEVISDGLAFAFARLRSRLLPSSLS